MSDVDLSYVRMLKQEIERLKLEMTKLEHQAEALKEELFLDLLKDELLQGTGLTATSREDHGRKLQQYVDCINAMKTTKALLENLTVRATKPDNPDVIIERATVAQQLDKEITEASQRKLKMTFA